MDGEESVYDTVLPKVFEWYLIAKELGVDLKQFDCNKCVDELLEILEDKIPEFMIEIIKRLYRKSA